MTPQLYTTLMSFKAFFKRHHPIIFISLVGLLLAGAVFTLYQVLALSSVDASSTTSTIGNFDKKTVDMIKNLQISSDKNTSDLVFPSPRPNPFVEQ